MLSLEIALGLTTAASGLRNRVAVLQSLDAHAAMAYYWDNSEAIDKQMKEADEFVDQLRAATGPGPLERKLGGMDSGSDSVSS